jgi:very-short-patch-repair endonuclease
VHRRPETGPVGTHLIPILGVCAELAVSGSRDQRIQAIAEQQQGRINRRQLQAAGINDQAIRRLVRRDRLLPLPAGVFAVGHLATSELADRAAALLAVGFEAMISRLTAAAGWELARPARSGLIHVLAPMNANTRVPGVCVHRTRYLAPQDIRVLNGLPITSPARTLLDIAELVTPRQLELAFDRGLVARIMYRDDLTDLLSRTRGRAGGPRLRALLERERGSTLTRSEAEERFLALIRRGGLPRPEVNARIENYEVDFLWRAQGLVVEIDGFRYHATRRAFEHDHRKDTALRAARLQVLRFTPEQVQENGHAVVVDVARGLWNQPN